MNCSSICCFCNEPICGFPLILNCQFNCICDIYCLLQQESVYCPFNHFIENDFVFCNNNKSLVLNILSKNEYKKQICDICYEEYSIIQFIPISSLCNHYFCIYCCFSYISINIINNNILKCLYKTCNKDISIELLKEYIKLSNSYIFDYLTKNNKNIPKLSLSLLDIYENKQIIQIIPIEQQHYCPKCEELLILEYSLEKCLSLNSKVKCTYCNYIYCIQCLESWHNNQTCNEYQYNKIISSSTNNIKYNNTSNNNLMDCIKRCPKCYTLTIHYKYHGCHHIHPKTGCPKCGLHYCYECLKPRWPCKTKSCKITCSIRCSCPLCPECKIDKPCSQCNGCPKCTPDDYKTRKTRNKQIKYI